MANLVFIPNVADEGEGLSDAGIETYRDNPFPAIARETSQNSRDAHDRDRVGSEPVVVVIDKLEIQSAELPGILEYKRVVELCLEIALELNSKKEIEFFRQAKKVLHKETIPILRISDSNTKGLKGPCVEGSPFHSLVKSSGVSTKDDPTAGGSFGIGKSAVYSASDLQTVFYSTVFQGPTGTLEYLCQGKTKFRSFSDGTSRYRSVGYWGDPDGFMPISNPAEAPSWLQRTSIGTTVCSIAVRDTDAWANEVAASLVLNFFSAIHSRQMVFQVDGMQINDNTLLRHFANADIEMAAQQAGQADEFSFAKAMYECLTNTDDVHLTTLEVSSAGSFHVRILMREGLPKRVGILRNGMLICDSMGHFGDHFSRFSMYRDFVAIVEPGDEEASAWLRELENPRHDELSPERIVDPERRAKARQAGSKLAKKIRDAIKSTAQVPIKEQTELEELSEFFALENFGRPDDLGVRNPASFKIKDKLGPNKKRRTKSPVRDTDGDDGGAVRGKEEGTNTGGSGDGTGNGNGTGGDGTRSSKRPFVLFNPRTIVLDADNPVRRRIHFTPECSGRALLEFESSGLSDPAKLDVAGGPVRVECRAGHRHQIEVEFTTPYDGPIEILSWAEGEENNEVV